MMTVYQKKLTGDTLQKKKITTNFVNNMSLPLHRWFRFPAGFSAEWVKQVINTEKTKQDFRVFDPFLGSGTTVIASEETNVNGIGIDSHPLLCKIARTKLLWRSDLSSFNERSKKIIEDVKSLPSKELDYPKLINKMYTSTNLDELDKIRRSWVALDDDSDSSKLCWLSMISILRHTSSGGTAPWQYVLPKKKKKQVATPIYAFKHQCKMISNDISYFQSRYLKSPNGIIFDDDARTCSKIESDSIDLVITSPPYANNYDYADATRLELSFLGQIEKWSDLHEQVRQFLIRACSQHMTSKNTIEEFVSNPKLEPIYDELVSSCNELERIRETKKGKKRYHTMVAAYFSDLADTWHSLRRVTKDDSTVCFVIGDSAPYGVHLPVERWFGEIALHAGFKEYTFEKIRDRNTKWKLDRKHKVLLKEGNLWVKG